MAALLKIAKISFRRLFLVQNHLIFGEAGGAVLVRNERNRTLTPPGLKAKLQTSATNTREHPPRQINLVLHQERANLTQMGYFWARILILGHVIL